MSSASGSRTLNPAQLQKALEVKTSNDSELFRLIVNTPFAYKVETAYLFLGIVVLLLVNKKTNEIDRVALSDTELATNTTNVSAIPFKDIRIPMGFSENIIAQAIATGKPQDTIDWKFLFAPVLPPEQARINQASGGIAYSAVCPLTARDGGALIYSYFQYSSEIGSTQQAFMKTYTELVNKRLSVS